MAAMQRRRRRWRKVAKHSHLSRVLLRCIRLRQGTLWPSCDTLRCSLQPFAFAKFIHFVRRLSAAVVDAIRCHPHLHRCHPRPHGPVINRRVSAGTRMARAPPSLGGAADMSVPHTRVITVCKPTPDATIGVRMRTTAAGATRIVALHPAGALALHLRDSGEAPIDRGARVVSINGIACDDGPEQAVQLMRQAPHEVRIELASPRAAEPIPPMVGHKVLHAFRCRLVVCSVAGCVSMKARLMDMRQQHVRLGCLSPWGCAVCQLWEALRGAGPETSATHEEIERSAPPTEQRQGDSVHAERRDGVAAVGRDAGRDKRARVVSDAVCLPCVANEGLHTRRATQHQRARSRLALFR